MKHSINAITGAECVGIALEMHVRSAALQRLQQQQVHQSHHRRFVRQVHQVVECHLARCRIATRWPRSHSRDYAFGRHRITRIRPTNRLPERCLGKLHERDVIYVEQNSQIIQCLRIDCRWLAPRGGDERTTMHPHGHDAVMLQIRRRQTSRERPEQLQIARRNCQRANSVQLTGVSHRAGGLMMIGRSVFDMPVESVPSRFRLSRYLSVSSSVAMTWGVMNR